MFKDREEAGKKLVEKISASGDDYIVLGISRGGIVVAKEISDRFDFDLRVMISRELHDSINPDAVIGAVSPDRSYALDRDTVEKFGIKDDYIDRIVRIESMEIERRMMKYTGSREFESVEDRNVIIVDDGLVSKYLMGVSVKYLKSMGAKKIVVAVPVVLSSLVESFGEMCDEVVFVESVDEMEDVSKAYKKYPKIMDDDVMKILGR